MLAELLGCPSVSSEVDFGHLLKWCLYGFSTVHSLFFSKLMSELQGDSFETINILFLNQTIVRFNVALIIS